MTAPTAAARLTDEQVREAREAFEVFSPSARLTNGEYTSFEARANWRAYLAATERMQERVDRLQAALDELVRCGNGSESDGITLEQYEAAWAVAIELSRERK